MSGSSAVPCFILFTSLVINVVIVGACQNARDCGYGGKCVNSKCECFPTWKGNNCTLFNLEPAKTSKAFYRPQQSSWGGSVLKGSNGSYHMMVATMENNCGLNSWECNSAITHAIANNPQGPYEEQKTILEAFGSNPTLHYDPVEKLYLIFHIGLGTSYKKRMHCINGVTNGTCGSTRSSKIGVGVGMSAPNVLYSPSLDGPWKEFGEGSAWVFNNPALYIFPNGTVLMFYKIGCSSQVFCRQYAVARAPHWRGPYTFIKNLPVYGEDAYVWRQPIDGSFHMLVQGGNYLPFIHYNGHWHTAFSPDGLNWESSTWAPVFTNTIPLVNGTKLTFPRRERHQLLFNDQGWPSHLFNGVTTGYEDFSYTSVQPIAVPKTE